MKRIQDVASIFHLLIIASFLLGFSGCGYKANPYYQEEAPTDENVEFIIQKKEFDKDTNESCN